MAFDQDKLNADIIKCIIRVHQILGPGFREYIYKRALIIELTGNELSVESEKRVVIYYGGHRIGHHDLDLVVEGRVVVELKTVAALGKEHYAQVRSYLKASGLPVGLLVNFSGERADFRRVKL